MCGQTGEFTPPAVYTRSNTRDVTATWIGRFTMQSSGLWLSAFLDRAPRHARATTLPVADRRLLNWNRNEISLQYNRRHHIAAHVLSQLVLAVLY